MCSRVDYSLSSASPCPISKPRPIPSWTMPHARGYCVCLARVLDHSSRYARAAHCLRGANRLCLERAPHKNKDYCANQHDRFVDAPVHGCDAGFYEIVAWWGLKSRRPILVVGLPRSGATLVEQVRAATAASMGPAIRELSGRSPKRFLPRLAVQNHGLAGLFAAQRSGGAKV